MLILLKRFFLSPKSNLLNEIRSRKRRGGIGFPGFGFPRSETANFLGLYLRSRHLKFPRLSHSLLVVRLTINFVEMDGETLARLYEVNTGIGYLSSEEVAFAAKAVKDRHCDRNLQFIEINFLEPTKEELFAYYMQHKAAAPRNAQVITMDISLNQTLIDIVSLSQTSSKLDSFTKRDTTILQDVQAGLSPDEYSFVEKLIKAYEPLREAIAKRGLDPEGICADAWCCGHTGPDCNPTERICWPSLHFSEKGKDDLPYARPIEGINIRISLTNKKVILFEDTGFGDLPIPGSFESYQPGYVKAENERKGLKPILITQPEGPSWTVTDGNVVDWQNWRFQVGFNSREGLTLHGITYNSRPILHRFSLCEMVVPYGDPRSPHCLKNAFDAGEDGLGRNANSLVLGCDCLGLIRYFDGNLCDDSGDIMIVKNAVCMHEEDVGLGWKHTDWRTQIPFTRRNRRIALSFTTTIANYEYGFFYYFYLDGTIEMDVKLTGVLSTGAFSASELDGGRKYGISLGGNLYAPVHQHLFVARMDTVIDGTENRVVEMNVEAETEGPHNPTGNAFFFTEKLLKTEDEAARDCCPETARFWKIQSTKRNKIGGLTGWKLVPETKVGPFVQLHKASHLKRAEFLKHQLWVTPCREAERYPAGDFVNQNPNLEGLCVWTKEKRSIVDTDIVIWHVFGVTHLPRPEDWPIMPVEHCGFHLKPSGFFEFSPSIDVPPSKPSHCHDNNNSCSDTL